MKFHSPPTKRARIEIIPMIDAIFFLLVFFMFSSLSMVKMRGMETNLPTDRAMPARSNTASATRSNPLTMSPTTAAQAAEIPKLIVTLTESGEYYINKTRVSANTLSNALEQEAGGKPGAVVIVNVAKGQTTQSLINVIDSVNRVKLRSGKALPVLIATETVDANGVAVNSPASAQSR